MKINLKPLLSFVIITLAFSVSQATHSTDELLKSAEQKKPSGMQLSPGPNDTLFAVLGTGNNVMLKVSVDLSTLKKPLNKGQVEVSARVFLTDFASAPTTHQSVFITIPFECESTSPKVNLPTRPESFDNLAHYTEWLNQGYFTNENNITYDFHIDPMASAPTLAQQLFSVMPGGYRFIGMHAIHNSKIALDSCTPKITYNSERGNKNITTVTLGGILYLDKKPYPIEDHQQVFPHGMIEEKALKRDETKKFYHHQWLARSEVIVRTTYEEFPSNQIQSWPGVPSESYNLLQKKPGEREEIKHLRCLDGTTGDEIDISDGRIFSIECEEINGKGRVENEAIVSDTQGKLYSARYQNLQTQLSWEKSLALVTSFQEAGTLHVIDLATKKAVGAPIKLGRLPQWMAITPDRSLVFVVTGGEGIVNVIDTATRTVVGNPINVGRGTNGFAITPDGKLGLVSCAFSNSISVIDIGKGNVMQTINVNNPRNIAITPNGQLVLVIDCDSVNFIDIATRAVVGNPIKVGNPADIAITPDGKLALVANNACNAIKTDRVIAIDITERKIVGNPINVEGMVSRIAITLDGKIALVTKSHDGTLIMVDIATQKIVGDPVKIEGHPVGIAVFPVAKHN